MATIQMTKETRGIVRRMYANGVDMSVDFEFPLITEPFRLCSLSYVRVVAFTGSPTGIEAGHSVSNWPGATASAIQDIAGHTAPNLSNQTSLPGTLSSRGLISFLPLANDFDNELAFSSIGADFQIRWEHGTVTVGTFDFCIDYIPILR